MAGNRELRITIVGDANSAKKALGGLETTTTKTSTALKKVGAIATSAFGALGAASLLKDATKAAAEEGQEMAILANTLRKATGASKDQIASTEKWITKMQNATGILDDQLRPALAKLVIAGRSVAQAEQDLGVAADIAAARHVELATVVQAMSKAALGNNQALGRLGIATKNAAGETLSYDEILKNAAKTMGGAAAVAADTAAGRAAILQAKMQDLKESVGTALLPVMEKLTTVVVALADGFAKLSPAMQTTTVAAAALILVLGPLVSVCKNLATIGRAVVWVVGTVATAFGISVTAAAAVVAAIVAVVAIVVVAYVKFKGFRDVVNAVGETIGKFFVGAVRLAISAVERLISLMEKAIDLGKKLPNPAKAVGSIPGKVGGAVDKVLPGHGLIPHFADGGVMPGPLGKHRLAYVAGGETVLPTHKGSASRGVSIGSLTIVSPQPHDAGRQFLWELGRIA